MKSTKSRKSIVLKRLPNMREFCMQWKAMKAIEWRQGYRDDINTILNSAILPVLGDMRLDTIARTNVLEFRSTLVDPHTGADGRTRQRSNVSVNRIMRVLKQILAEAELQYGLSNPCVGITKLKARRSPVDPFTLNEAFAIIREIGPDLECYMAVRFFAGLRSAEINGLKWKNVDLERGQLQIRETLVKGRLEYTKTEGSQRDVPLNDYLMSCLRDYKKSSAPSNSEDFVFRTARGNPIDGHNFCNRRWRTTLAKLDLKYRRPYQTRHSAATFWLGAGENPEWVARVLGHVNTTMLFSVYSRYVPNLTRRDGSAFEQVLKRGMFESKFSI